MRITNIVILLFFIFQACTYTEETFYDNEKHFIWSKFNKHPPIRDIMLNGFIGHSLNKISEENKKLLENSSNNFALKKCGNLEYEKRDLIFTPGYNVRLNIFCKNIDFNNPKFLEDRKTIHNLIKKRKIEDKINPKFSFHPHIYEINGQLILKVNWYDNLGIEKIQIDGKKVKLPIAQVGRFVVEPKKGDVSTFSIELYDLSGNKNQMFVNFDNKKIKSDILKSKTLSSKQTFFVKNNSKLKSKKIRELQQSKQTKHKSANEIGSGFYVSKFRHIVTNQHVVNQCNKITVGDSISKQIPATLLASDRLNDLAILQTISMEMASADTKSFVQKLSIQVVPVLSGGLMRSEDVVGGEEIFVAGFPLANQISDSLKLSDGIVSSTKGYENDISKFEISSVVRKGNSGGPIYDKKGNIVGVVVEQVNVSRSDNVNFAIKGSTVKQFLSAHNVPTRWSNRKDNIDTKDIYKIASKQTVMVVCHRD